MAWILSLPNADPDQVVAVADFIAAILDAAQLANLSVSSVVADGCIVVEFDRRDPAHAMCKSLEREWRSLYERECKEAQC